MEPKKHSFRVTMGEKEAYTEVVARFHKGKKKMQGAIEASLMTLAVICDWGSGCDIGVSRNQTEPDFFIPNPATLLANFQRISGAGTQLQPSTSEFSTRLVEVLLDHFERNYDTGTEVTNSQLLRLAISTYATIAPLIERGYTVLSVDPGSQQIGRFSMNALPNPRTEDVPLSLKWDTTMVEAALDISQTLRSEKGSVSRRIDPSYHLALQKDPHYRQKFPGPRAPSCAEISVRLRDDSGFFRSVDRISENASRGL